MTSGNHLVIKEKVHYTHYQNILINHRHVALNILRQSSFRLKLLSKNCVQIATEMIKIMTIKYK